MFYTVSNIKCISVIDITHALPFLINVRRIYHLYVLCAIVSQKHFYVYFPLATTQNEYVLLETFQQSAFHKIITIDTPMILVWIITFSILVFNLVFSVVDDTIKLLIF